MAHLLTISDIKLERERLLNSMAILPLSYKFTEQEKEDLKVIYEDTLKIYDAVIARGIEVNFSEKPDFSATPKIIISQNKIDEIIKKNDFKIILITGEAGSGKTKLANKIATNFNNVFFLKGSSEIKCQKFIFQNVTPYTDLIILDDVFNRITVENFVFNFFSNDTLKIEKRGLAPFNIKTPKLIITADSDNCNIEQLSESVKRRLLIVKL